LGEGEGVILERLPDLEGLCVGVRVNEIVLVLLAVFDGDGIKDGVVE
jgi:hypothetical protein